MNELLKTIPTHWKLLSPEFFARPADIVAPDLLTCVLLRKTGAGWMGGPICETEAYTEDEPASHTFRGKNEHNSSMFDVPSTIYVYRSYGIHYCINFSTGRKDRGEGVLIRALSATFGIDAMVPGASKEPYKLCSGPGRLCAALKIDKTFDGQLMGQGDISVWQTTIREDFKLVTGVRVGISKAIELNWRFGIENHPSLSKPFRQELIAESSKQRGTVKAAKTGAKKVPKTVAKKLPKSKTKAKTK